MKDPAGIAVVSLADPRAPRATVLVVHGLGEHAGRYRELATHLGGHRLRVRGATLPGHGPDALKLGISGWRRVRDALARTIVDEYTGAADGPLFLFGHSLGGQLLVRLLSDRDPRRDLTARIAVRGLILSSPFFAPNLRDLTLRKMWLGVLSRRGLTATQREVIVRDIADSPAHQAALIDDPSLHGSINPLAFWPTRRRRAAMAAALRIPLLMGVATDERIVSPRAQEAFVAAGPDTMRLVRYDALHELHQCHRRQEWFDDVAAWIAERLADDDPLPAA